MIDKWWPMIDTWWPWILRVLWIILPFTAGPLFGDALSDGTRAVQVTGTVGLWGLWACGLLATAIPHTLTLTPIRILAPGGVAVAVWATASDGLSGAALIGLTSTAIAAAAAMAPVTAAGFVNGSAYGDERRLPLRPPVTMLLGPIPLAWAIAVAVLGVLPLAAAAQRWVVTGLMAAICAPLAVLSYRALHRLAGRWLVFVPAGLVVHDPIAVPDPVLFKRTAIRAFGPALATSTATDLTMGASGLALELRVRETVEISYRQAPGAEPVTTELEAVLVAPSRPGAVLDEAKRRRITVA
jgi:hypothetical protein